MIDSHAHLTSDRIYPIIDEVLERAKEAGVEKIVNICTDPVTLERGLELAKKYDWIHNAAATTPHDVVEEGEHCFDLMASHARNKDLVAVGETGLEYHYFPETTKVQKEFLVRYLHLAIECSLPVVIHCREGFNDLFEILDAEYKVKGEWAPGVLHCFTGTMEEAKEVIRRNWYLSLSGITTYKKSEELRKVARWVPDERLLIETDSPYLAPQPRRGKQNEPAFLPFTAELIAEARGVDANRLAKQTASNAESLFGI